MAELGKKKKVRGGHRGHAKNLISQVTGAVDIYEPSMEIMVRQKKISLEETMNTLRTLDDEIIDLIEIPEDPEDDTIEREIEEACGIREKIVETLLKIEAVLSKQTSEGNNVSTVNIPTNASQENSTSTGAASASSTSENSQSEATVGDSVINTSANGQQNVVKPKARSTIKLPKLELKKFYGNPKLWQSFWDSFSTAVDSNESLEDVEKFNYLKNLVEGAALSTISGLSLTSENYNNAIALLKQRFGNEQVIINSHMNALINMHSLTKTSDLKKLRKFYDEIEVQVRGLESLKVLSGEYGSMMTSILMSKLPDDLKLIIGRKLESVGQWSLTEVMKVLRSELETRERCGLQNMTVGSERETNTPRITPTAAALMTTDQSKYSPSCTYCKGKHTSKDCNVVTNIPARKKILRNEGRCFICLRKSHIARQCQSLNTCFRCSGKHHVSVCDNSGGKMNERNESTSTTAAMCVSSNNVVLLQTAQVDISGNCSEKKITANLIFDSGSQKSYICQRARNSVSLPAVKKQTMLINSFGKTSQEVQECDIVKFTLHSRCNDFQKEIDAFVVETICSPLHYQNISGVKEKYNHLANLILADQRTTNETVDVDILIGSDHMWEFLTGETKRGERGPIATKTEFGWVLSGPVEVKHAQTKLSSVNFVNTHVLRTSSAQMHVELEDDNSLLKEDIHKLWDLDSIGIREKTSVLESFEENVSIQDGRYKVKLPFKDNLEVLPDNYNMSLVRLNSLMKRLKKDPEVMKEYDRVIQEQIAEGIVEPVAEGDNCSPGTVHYIPHQPVVRKESLSTKLRVVYDASAKASKSTPSLNECLNSGPPLSPLIIDILLRFRSFKYGIVSDIEKAFLQIAVDEAHRDYLRFLWVKDINAEDPEIIILRFARVIFGVNASPFLLNATLQHHIMEYFSDNKDFAETLLNSLYVDDLSTGTNDIEEGYEIYKQSKQCLAQGGFNLRKWASNSGDLMKLIKEDCESVRGSEDQSTTGSEGIIVEDTSYAKIMLGDLNVDMNKEHKVLGMNWDCELDTFIFKLNDIVELARSLPATKRNLIRIYSKLFDPLGILSPMFAELKMLFQELCAMKIEWDEPMPTDKERVWNRWLTDAEKLKFISVPRFIFAHVDSDVMSTHLVGFGDSSKKCYAAVVYLLVGTSSGYHVSLVSSKTRLAPLSSMTIPRLELLAALILARLMSTVKKALESVLNIDETTCFSDSKTVLHWIHGGKELKQFCQNRVNEILSLTRREDWRHCPGRENPADIGSRGILPTELRDNSLWWSGPAWLRDSKGKWPTSMCEQYEPTEESPQEERKCKIETSTLLNSTCNKVNLNNIIQCERFSDIHKLMRVTAYVKRFVRNVKNKIRREHNVVTSMTVTPEELAESEQLWLLEIQSALPGSVSNYEELATQLGVFVAEGGVKRCMGRFGRSILPYETKHPALLPRNHHITRLYVEDAHRRVNHCGVKDTLNELRSRFWITRGRQFVKHILFSCYTCRKVMGQSYNKPKTSDLPDFRTCEIMAFSKVGCDMAGPLYIKHELQEPNKKVYICLFTCTASRAVHLEVVPDLTTEAFIRALDRFTSRRGLPQLIISDNATTFKAANKLLLKIFKQDNVQKYLANKNITWKFILEKAPWWGGFYERLIGVVKRCLKKVLGNSCLNYEELVTVVTNVEATLNSRPLTYIYSDEHEEPLTPSHLLTGRRILSLPSVVENTNVEESTEDVVTKRMLYLDTLIKHFWNRWSKDYLLDLRAFHNCGAGRQKSNNVSVGDFVLIHEQTTPRQNWRKGVVQGLITSTDGEIRAARVRVLKKSGKSSLLNRPLELLFPVELAQKHLSCSETDAKPVKESGVRAVKEVELQKNTRSGRPRRAAAVNADKQRRVLISNL